jgi:hypothetical protein
MYPTATRLALEGEVAAQRRVAQSLIENNMAGLKQSRR